MKMCLPNCHRKTDGVSKEENNGFLQKNKIKNWEIKGNGSSIEYWKVITMETQE